MLNHPLQIAEYIFIVGSVVGWVVAVVSGQLIYAAVPLSVYLLLNLTNRFRLEQRNRRRIAAAMAQMRRQLLQESQSLHAQQIKEAIASLQAQLPEYISWIEASDQESGNSVSDATPLAKQDSLTSQELEQPVSEAGRPPTGLPPKQKADRSIIHIKAQLASLEKSLSSVVQYLNSTSLPTRVERLEKAIYLKGTATANASTSDNITQISPQLPNPRKRRTDEIEKQSQRAQSSDISLPVTQSITEPQPLTPPTESVTVEPKNFSPWSPTWSYLHTLRGHTDWIYSIAISPDRQTLASGSFDKTIKLWELSTGSLTHTLSEHSKGVFCVAISPDGQTLASGSWDETIKLWRLDTGELIRTLRGHTASVRSLTIAPDSQTLISGSFDETIKIWYMNTGECLRTITDKVGPVSAIALTPDGQTIASGGSDGIITLRQLDTSESGEKPAFTLTLTGNLSSINSLAISPDGQTLAAGCTDGNVKLWQLSTGALLDVLQCDSGPVTSAVFSFDGQTLIGASANGTIKIWALDTREQLGILANDFEGSVMSVAVSSDGQLIAGGGADSIIKIWQRHEPRA